MAKGSGSTRSGSRNTRGFASPEGAVSRAAEELRASVEARRMNQKITNGWYELDGRRVFVISNDEIDSYKGWNKAQLRDEAIRLNRGIYADEPGRSKADYLGDILTARFGSRNVITEREITREQRKKLVRR